MFCALLYCSYDLIAGLAGCGMRSYPFVFDGPKRIACHEEKKLDTDEDMAFVSDNPELTDEELARAVPASEFFTPEELASLTGQKPRARGPQKTPTKELVTLRLEHRTQKWNPVLGKSDA